MQEKSVLPRSCSYFMRHLSDGSGGVIPTLFFDNKPVKGFRLERLTRGTVSIEATPVKGEDGNWCRMAYRVRSNLRQQIIASGTILEPGKYRFFIERKRGKLSREHSFVGRLNYESLADIKKKQAALRKCDDGDTSVWEDLCVVSTEDGKKPMLAVKFGDGSLIDATGKIIEICHRDGRSWRAPRICFARRWFGRGVEGVWDLSERETPESIVSRLEHAALLVGEKEASFKLFSDFPDLATVLRAGEGSYEIIAPEVVKTQAKS